ncbi:hypothetical protein QQ045_007878 [Rhodiola kirilowii]
MAQFKAILKLLLLGIFCFVSVLGAPAHHHHHHHHHHRNGAVSDGHGGLKRSHFAKMHGTPRKIPVRVNHGSSRGPRKHLINLAAQLPYQAADMAI